MLSLIIILWNMLFAVVPASQDESPYISPLHGYIVKAKSTDSPQHSQSDLTENFSSDSDDSDDSEDSDNDLNETAFLHKSLHNNHLPSLQRKQNSLFEYQDRLTQAHINPIITPPDTNTRILFIA